MVKDFCVVKHDSSRGQCRTDGEFDAVYDSAMINKNKNNVILYYIPILNLYNILLHIEIGFALLSCACRTALTVKVYIILYCV